MENHKISKEWILLFNNFNEIQKRCAAAIKAKELGYGGVSEVSRVTGLSRSTINRGLNELDGLNKLPYKKGIRSAGGGRKALSDQNNLINTAINRILQETTAGDPMQPLIWTSKSVRKIALELNKNGIDISKNTVYRIMLDFGYSLQSNRKSLSGKKNPDRNEQFEYINNIVLAFMSANLPVISVDAKKKELVGNFKNDGKDWKKKGKPDPPRPQSNNPYLNQVVAADKAVKAGAANESESQLPKPKPNCSFLPRSVKKRSTGQ